MKPKLLTTLQDYSWLLFIGDLAAGLTVALVALPLSIAIAIASGATPRAGLIVVVASVIAQFGFDGLLLATLIAGLILVAGGLVRAGRFIALVPEPVIEGFTVGIALIIAVSQLKDLLGLSAAHVPADLVHGLPALWAARTHLNVPALAVGLFAVAGIALLRRFVPGFPVRCWSSQSLLYWSPRSRSQSTRSSRASGNFLPGCPRRRSRMSASPGSANFCLRPS